MVEESMRKGRVQPAKAADDLLFFDILIIRHSKLNKENKKAHSLQEKSLRTYTSCHYDRLKLGANCLARL